MQNLFWRMVLSSSLILGVAYLWGYAYHQTDLSTWGFDPALFPINTQEVYVTSFLAFLTTLSYPLIWINQLPAVWVVSIVIGTMVLPFIAAWVATRRQVRDRIQRWRRFMCRSEGTRLSSLQRGARWAFVLWVAVFSIPTAMSALTLAGLIIIGPPLNAARARAHDGWVQKVFQKWPAVKWADETGKLNSGNLKTCSLAWCAIVQDGRAITVPLNAVRKIERSVPMEPSVTN